MYNYCAKIIQVHILSMTYISNGHCGRGEVQLESDIGHAYKRLGTNSSQYSYTMYSTFDISHDRIFAGADFRYSSGQVYTSLIRAEYLADRLSCWSYNRVNVE